ncbi:MAG: hypothetical protein NC299_02005 [Lachnospiraceae bacterium]|nr:hypothetical protein [Ruminococcus sp.]MCM1274123.1 hypothetical protein [Lachnospiraceae bacterium]
MRIKRLFFALLSAAIICISGCSGGLTADKLTITLNGETVSKPLTAEKLGEGYSVGNFLLKYDGEPVAGVTYTEKTADREESKRELRSLVVGANSGAEGCTLSVNGITLGSASSEALEAFGEPSAKEDGMWFYRERGKPEGESFLGMRFDDSDTVTWLYVRVDT